MVTKHDRAGSTHLDVSIMTLPDVSSCPRDPVVPSQKVRLDPPGTYITLPPITVPEKVRLDP